MAKTVGERTFCMIKPDSYQDKNIGGILNKIEETGFQIVGMKMVKITKYLAGKFYEIHKERPFYDELCDFMSSDKVITLVLEKDNAVADLRKLMGATNPEEAEEGTIRKEFARNVGENAVHGSDSKENAEIEINFFYSEMELFDED